MKGQSSDLKSFLPKFIPEDEGNKRIECLFLKRSRYALRNKIYAINLMRSHLFLKADMMLYNIERCFSIIVPRYQHKVGDEVYL